MKLSTKTKTKIAESIEILHNAMKMSSASFVVAMFSGGGDSTCAAYVTEQFVRHYNKVAKPRTKLRMNVVHLDTGIKVNETTDFVKEQCEKRGWNLTIAKANKQRVYPKPVKVRGKLVDHSDALTSKEKRLLKKTGGYLEIEQYEFMVRKFGFPGPAMHFVAYNRLKGRALDNAMKMVGRTRHDSVILSSGVREAESVRRMGTKQEIAFEKQGSRYWVAPIYRWTDEDKHRLIRECKIETNPVHQIMCMSGECLCGCYAWPEEFSLLKHFYPSSADEIIRLSKLAKSLGKPHVWGCYNKDEAAIAVEMNGEKQMMCTSCNFKAALGDKEAETLVELRKTRKTKRGKKVESYVKKKSQKVEGSNEQ